MIYLDSCVLIYLFESHPVLGPRVQEALFAHPKSHFAISPLVKFECLVGPIRSGNLQLQQYYEEGFGQFQQLPISEKAFLLAATIRGRFGLKPPDALHLAIAQIHCCDALWTNDSRLDQAAHGLARDIFLDILPGLKAGDSYGAQCSAWLH